MRFHLPVWLLWYGQHSSHSFCVCGFVSVIIFQKIRLFSTSLSVISTKGALPPPFSHHNINLSFISVRRYISYGIIIIKHITLSASYDLCLAYKHCRESQFVSTRLPSGILAWHLNASTMSLDAADVTCLTWFDKSKLWFVCFFFVFFLTQETFHCIEILWSCPNLLFCGDKCYLSLTVLLIASFSCSVSAFF